MKQLIIVSLCFLIMAFGVSVRGLEGGRAEIPMGFPEVVHPADNEPNDARWRLGKKLFYDPIMSDDGTVSCASCHAPELAFSDDVALSAGIDGLIGTQNAPSLTNVAYHPYLTRAGGVPTLEQQILVPIQEHNELGSNIIEIAERMSDESVYVEMSAAAYGRRPDAFVITRALACFERSLISGNSRYDQYVYQDDVTALTDLEKEGMALFFSERAQCGSCHGGFNLTNYSFANNGLYLHYPDSGRQRLTGLEADRALFKVPSLRNVGYTAPYMHDGSLASLEEVVEHYSKGIAAHKNLSPLLRPLRFNKKEKKQLLAFLRTLDDQAFVSDVRLSINDQAR